MKTKTLLLPLFLSAGLLVACTDSKEEVHQMENTSMMSEKSEMSTSMSDDKSKMKDDKMTEESNMSDDKNKMKDDKMAEKSEMSTSMSDDKSMMKDDKMAEESGMSTSMTEDKNMMKDDEMTEDKDMMKDDEMKQVNEGKPAPEFELKDISGKTYKLSDFKGKKVYLKFWASWCSICLSTLRDTDELAGQVEGKDYVVLTVVSPGQRGEKSEEDFKKWYEGLDYQHIPVLLDSTGQLLKEYGVRAYPTTAFIGSDGVLVDTHLGFMDKAAIENKLKEIH